MVVSYKVRKQYIIEDRIISSPRQKKKKVLVFLRYRLWAKQLMTVTTLSVFSLFQLVPSDHVHKHVNLTYLHILQQTSKLIHPVLMSHCNTSITFLLYHHSVLFL